MPLEAAGCTDKGRVRDQNEDTILVDVEHRLFAVADGCGGHAAGEVASSQVVEILAQRARPLGLAEAPREPRERAALLQQLGEEIHQAGVAIYERGQAEPQFAGMATTATVLLVRGDGGYVAHIGDSRLYCLREGQLLQLTKDHTLAAEMVRRGLMEPLDIKTWVYRNTLQRALGHIQQAQIDTILIDLQPADVLLLCSDGLHGLLEDEQIRRELGRIAERGCDGTARQLVDLANEYGGTDNVSAVVIRVL